MKTDETKDLLAEEIASAGQAQRGAEAWRPDPRTRRGRWVLASMWLRGGEAAPRWRQFLFEEVCIGLAVLAVGLVWMWPQPTVRRESWMAVLVERGSTLDVVERSVGGLHGATVLADVQVQLVRDDTVPDMPGARADTAIWSAHPAADSGGDAVSDRARAVIKEQAELRVVVASAVGRKYPEMGLEGLIREGETRRVRVDATRKVGYGLFAALMALLLVESAGTLPRFWSLERRARRISKGCCPSCGFELANLRDRRCPECGLDVTPEEFNLVRGVWRERGVGR